MTSPRLGAATTMPCASFTCSKLGGCSGGRCVGEGGGEGGGDGRGGDGGGDGGGGDGGGDGGISTSSSSCWIRASIGGG